MRLKVKSNALLALGRFAEILPPCALMLRWAALTMRTTATAPGKSGRRVSTRAEQAARHTDAMSCSLAAREFEIMDAEMHEANLT